MVPSSFTSSTSTLFKELSTHVLCNHLNQWFPKSGLRPKKESRWVKNWVAPRRSKLQLDIFSVIHCFSVCLSVAWVLGETSRLPRLTPDLATFWQKSSTQLITFSIHCLGLGSRGVHQTQIWVALKKVWEWLTQNVQIVLFKTNVGFQVFFAKTPACETLSAWNKTISPPLYHHESLNFLIWLRWKEHLFHRLLGIYPRLTSTPCWYLPKNMIVLAVVCKLNYISSWFSTSVLFGLLELSVKDLITDPETDSLQVWYRYPWSHSHCEPGTHDLSDVFYIWRLGRLNISLLLMTYAREQMFSYFHCNNPLTRIIQPCG